MASDDLNTITLAGQILGKPTRISNPDSMIVSFDLSVSKTIRIDGRRGKKLSRFKVVLFDGVAAKNCDLIEMGMQIIVHGELDETQWEKPGEREVGREVRVVGRFVQIMRSER